LFPTGGDPQSPLRRPSASYFFRLTDFVWSRPFFHTCAKTIHICANGTIYLHRTMDFALNPLI
jgi:hypothetical protein